MARKSKLQRQKNLQNIVLSLVFFALVLLGLGAVVWWNTQRKAALDPVTLCPADGPLGQRVELIDRQIGRAHV